MKICKNFEITIADRNEFEKLLVQIHWGDIILCELNKERGDDQTETRLHCNDVVYNDTKINFPFADFLEVMRVADQELKRL